MAKRLFKVTILFCFIIACFAIPSFAVNSESCLINYTDQELSVSSYYDGFTYSLYNGRYNFVKKTSNYSENAFIIVTKYDPAQADSSIYHQVWLVFDNDDYASMPANPIIYLTYTQNAGISPSKSNFSVNNTYNLRYFQPTTQLTYITTKYVPVFNTIEDGLAYVRHFIDSGGGNAYQKNENVDEFIANTMISMGVKFETPAYAISYASDAWNWCIDEDNVESANAFDEWNIESFVSYCNAQSNNYLNWYNGYKVSKDVTNALGEYIRQNIQLLSGLPTGVTSLTSSYLPIYHYGSGFNSGASSPTAQTFYPAQTITYFNGEYVNEIDDISTSQFLYTPPDVRRFLGYPGSSPVITPSSPTGTGTITNDPNNPDQKNITINFPALDWLADAIKSILDFLRDAFTTLANLLTQLLDAILGLFSDAFESLSDFGQGIIDWLYAIVAGFSTIGGNYIPASLWAVILPFILINIGVGLIMFVLRSH